MNLNDDGGWTHGVPLDVIQEALEAESYEIESGRDRLTIHNGNLVTELNVLPPAEEPTSESPVEAIVTLETTMPHELTAILESDSRVNAINAMATLGAITLEDGECYVGSRLTVYQGGDAWAMQIPLILYASVIAPNSILGAIRRMFSQEPSEPGTSSWTEEDLEFVREHLSQMSVCNTGGLGLTAEFGLKSGSLSAMTGDHDTALWQIMGDQPHPDLGGGLFCLLQMPHQIADEDRLDAVIGELNRIEMAPQDLPPHFGAWCRGKLGNNPAYVSFLPNDLHHVHGLAVNMSVWALHRAHLADAMLATMGAK